MVKLKLMNHYLQEESDSIIKKSGDMLFSGSFVVSGKCYARVEHVGEENFSAQLAEGAKKHKTSKTQN